ncbi:HABP4-PAI-RBP1 domain-containing protein [Mycena indigotica]|uniref:HABP4-PAI-RBP1 domain-containing protein n=1 Tax=Mycena indigotica TaxID=2126181 RepID=A0A8H6SY82_9AGAR|nr:HABP4-PAI-RBP1 domain-containing protein [Mycena indigotica]KAF7306967.1 HABP4-PAI-RBP1 domain-containing protein [Mycena indigotica]
MSVATKNPFALLEAEGASRPSSPVAPPKPVAAPAQAARGTPKSRGGPAARGGKYYARGGGKTASRDDNSGNPNQNGTEDAPQDKKFDGRGRGRGGSRGGPRGRGRQFDKHSQTGKVDSDKKINQGWGGQEGNAELKAEEAAISDANAEATPAAAAEWGVPANDGDNWAAPAGEQGAADKPEGRPRREREPEEEDNTLTLEQYLAQQKEKESTVVPKLESLRKVEDATWKDVVALEKGESDTYFVGKTKSAPKARTKKEEKVFIEIDGRFDRPSRGGPRGRGGDTRGRGTSSRGRGGSRGGRAAGGGSVTVDVDDEKAFPSLS